MTRYETLNKKFSSESPEAQEIASVVHWDIHSSREEVSKYIRQLQSILERLEWSDGPYAEACVEIINNALLHANMGIAKAEDEKMAEAEADPEIYKKLIRINGEISKNRIYLEIQDEGGEKGKQMMQNFGKKDPTAEENLLMPNGRGKLITNYAFGEAGIKIEFNELGTKVTLIKNK